MGSGRDSRPGLRPAWNWLSAAAVALGVTGMFLAANDNDPPDPAPPSTAPGPTISLDDLEAMLTNDAPSPTTVEVVTPEGPVRVVIPPSSTTTSAPTTTTTTTTAPPPTTVPRPPRGQPPVDAGGILDDLLGRTTIPEGAGGDP